MTRLVHFIKGFVLVGGVLIPAAITTPAGSSFLLHHPSVGALIAAYGGFAVVVYKWAKGSGS